MVYLRKYDMKNDKTRPKIVTENNINRIRIDYP
jgi:hypothetical protein